MKKKSKKSGIVFLKGKKVILRPRNKKTDLEKSARWINNPETRQYIEAFLPVTIQQEEEWLNKQNANNVHLSIDTLEGEFIGVMSIVKIDYRNGRAVTGAIIGDKKHRNKGYGTDAKMTLLKYAFHTLNMRKMITEIMAANGRSIRYNEKCGYKEVGRLKANDFVNGRFVDRVIMEVFRKDWEKIWKAYNAKN